MNFIGEHPPFFFRNASKMPIRTLNIYYFYLRCFLFEISSESCSNSIVSAMKL